MPPSVSGDFSACCLKALECRRNFCGAWCLEGDASGPAEPHVMTDRPTDLRRQTLGPGPGGT
jgi:hypothetical protein